MPANDARGGQRLGQFTYCEDLAVLSLAMEDNGFVDARRLELLLALSRLGSMRRVDEAFALTMSTVSQQIAALAVEVGEQLIKPDGRRDTHTPAAPPPA